MLRVGLFCLASFTAAAVAQTTHPGALNPTQSNFPVPLPVPTELADLSMAPPAFVPNLQDATPAPSAGPIRISGGVMANQVVTKVNPAYPSEAKSKGIQGSVVLSALIGKDGAVQNLAVVSGPPPLADAALTAVHQWTYRPVLLHGHPVEVRTTVTVNFHLDPPESSPSPQ